MTGTMNWMVMMKLMTCSSGHSSLILRAMSRTGHQQHVHVSACCVLYVIAPIHNPSCLSCFRHFYWLHESHHSDLSSLVGTEAFVPELETDLVIAPPPSHDLRRAMATAGVPLQPFKAGATPASCTVTARISWSNIYIMYLCTICCLTISV